MFLSCQHNLILAEVQRTGLFATCVTCRRDVSAEAAEVGRSYRYFEKHGYWVRESGGYGVKTNLLNGR